MSDVNGQPENLIEDAEVVGETAPVVPAEQPPPAPPAKMHARDIKVGRQGLTFSNAAEVMAYSRMMADSGAAVPPHLRGNPGACLAIVDDAIRFGMAPFALARESYLVESRTNGVQSVAYMAKALAGIIISRAPIERRPRIAYRGNGADLQCIVTFFPIGEEPIEHESPRIGDIKVKNSPLWASDPRQQLGYYTLRSGARLYFPDTLMGLYDVEELREYMARENDQEPEITPPARSGLAARLPGPQRTGFDPDHIEREVNGESSTKANLAASLDKDMGASVPSDRKDDPEVADFIGTLSSLLKSAKTELEVGAIRNQAAAQIEALPQEVAEEVATMIDHRIATLNKAKRRK